MDTPPAPSHEPSVAREVAGELGKAVRFAAEPLVEDAIGQVSMLVLLAILGPVAIAGLIVSFLLLAVVSMIGFPAGLLGSMVGIAWAVGTLVGIFFLLRTTYRRMPRRLRTAYESPFGRTPDPASLSAPVVVAVAPPADAGPRRAPSATAPTLAELDARLSPNRPEGGSDRTD